MESLALTSIQFPDTLKYLLNENGQVSGYSERYNGGSVLLGLSAWFYDGTSTTNIGLLGAEHTRNDGFKNSIPFQLNEGGQVLGNSLRFDGGNIDLGSSAWLYDSTTTIGIGLVGPEHTRDDGYKYSQSYELNEAGQVRGYSNRYDGSSRDLGRSAWLYDGATTKRIGLVGPEHTRSDGYKYSNSSPFNEAGQVCGYSELYNGGNSPTGMSAWIYDGTTTKDIGLMGPEFTRDNGLGFSLPDELNEAGQVSGLSTRYDGDGSDLGRGAWLYNGTSTIEIGLMGPEYTDGNGERYNTPGKLNEAGQVSGSSRRYDGGLIEPGYSAWLYDGTTTIDIGLVDAEHTHNSNYRYSVADELNEAGQVSGYSERYNGGSPALGDSA